MPRKNLRPLLGRPLVEYTIKAALDSKLLTRVILSTDDDEIMKVGRDCGVEVPFKRPPELAKDTTPTIGVLIQAVESMEKQGFFPDIIVILEPTSPLRQAEDIDNAIRKHIETDADSVVSVIKTDHWHPIRAKKIEDDILYDYCLEEKEGVRRQVLPPAYFRNGAFYSVKRDVLINERRLYGRITRPYIMPPERSVDINEEIDFRLAEMLLVESQGKIK
ncbi:MAG: acylneuraminate cytidylyltransferase family protein [Dehalococcoidia bacterium]|nr:acylneuraminate cytidylyltransferase family protein [Dehalococcoidia bacterium]